MILTSRKATWVSYSNNVVPCFLQSHWNELWSSRGYQPHFENHCHTVLYITYGIYKILLLYLLERPSPKWRLLCACKCFPVAGGTYRSMWEPWQSASFAPKCCYVQESLMFNGLWDQISRQKRLVTTILGRKWRHLSRDPHGIASAEGQLSKDARSSPWTSLEGPVIEPLKTQIIYEHLLFLLLLLLLQCLSHTVAESAILECICYFSLLWTWSGCRLVVLMPPFNVSSVFLILFFFYFFSPWFFWSLAMVFPI